MTFQIFLLFIFAGLKLTEEQVEDKIDNIVVLLYTNKVEEASQEFSSMKNLINTNIYYDSKYSEFLFQLGHYSELINNYGDNSNAKIKELVNESKKYLNMKLETVESLKKILAVSKYYKEAYVKLIKELLAAKENSEADILGDKLRAFYKSDKEAIKWSAMAKLTTYKYPTGVKLLADLPEYNKECKIFEGFILKYEEGISRKNIQEKIEELKKLYEKVQARECKDNNVRSIYAYFKYNVLLANYLEKNIEANSKGFEKLALELMTFNPTDRSKYIYLMSLRFNKNSQFSQKYNELKGGIKKYEYRNRLFEEIQKIGEEKKKMEKENQERAAREKSAPNAKNDKKGYYKILGISSTATLKEVKKAFLEKSEENNYAKYKDKDEVEYRKRHEYQKKLNKAKDTLTNKQSRQTYDSGIDESATGGGRSRGGAQVTDFGDIFEAMFGGQTGGGRSMPFSSGGRQQRGHYQQSTGGRGAQQGFYQFYL